MKKLHFLVLSIFVLSSSVFAEGCTQEEAFAQAQRVAENINKENQFRTRFFKNSSSIANNARGYTVTLVYDLGIMVATYKIEITQFGRCQVEKVDLSQNDG